MPARPYHRRRPPDGMGRAGGDRVPRRRDRNRPLFLVVSFPHPHAPYDPPEPYASMYDPADSMLPTDGLRGQRAAPARVPARASASTTQVARPRTRRRAARSSPPCAAGPPDRRCDRSRSWRSSTSTRRSCSSPRTTATIAGHRGLIRKTPWMPFDDLARVPFVVAGPGVAGGRRVASLVQSCDLALTCLDYRRRSPARRGSTSTPAACARSSTGTAARATSIAPCSRHHDRVADGPRGRYKYIDEHRQREAQCPLRPRGRSRRAGQPAPRSPRTRIRCTRSSLLREELDRPGVALSAAGRGRGLTLAPYGGGQIPFSPPAVRRCRCRIG